MIFLQFFVATLWHMWRVLTFRPAIEYVSDRRANIVAFAVLYFVMGLVKQSAMPDLSFPPAFLLVVEALILAAFSVRSGRSLMLFGFFLMTSASADAVYIVLNFVTDMTPYRNLMALWGFALYLSTGLAWGSQKDEVKLKGYVYNQSVSG